jgi:hypothetical protein
MTSRAEADRKYNVSEKGRARMTEHPHALVGPGIVIEPSPGVCRIQDDPLGRR